jgi:hypothetical protein
MRWSPESHASDIGIAGPAVFMAEVERHAPFSVNRYKAEIDRRRLARKLAPVVTNVYHLQGHSPRVNINSQDSSITNIIVSSEQVFQNLRSAIATLPDADERKDIIGKIEALEEAKDSPSFGERYTAFISAVANHITLVVPFIPALTEMLHRVL